MSLMRNASWGVLAFSIFSIYGYLSNIYDYYFGHLSAQWQFGLFFTVIIGAVSLVLNLVVILTALAKNSEKNEEFKKSYQFKLIIATAIMIFISIIHSIYVVVNG